MTHFHTPGSRVPDYDRDDRIAFRCAECGGIYWRPKRRSRKDEEDAVRAALATKTTNS